jgi:hypothetical protein
MAIKRTIGRSKFVQPTGIIPDSGGQAMAQASQNIANAITNITETVDKNQLDTALLEAEKQGLHVGSVTNKDGSPKPLDLMTLNSSFNPSMFNKSNQRKAKERFKQHAINAFGLNVQNHIGDYANDTLEKHRGSYGDGKTIVESNLTSYVNDWKSKVAPEVWNELQPSVNRIVGSATRKASAIHIQNLKTQALVSANKGLIGLADRRSSFIVESSLDDDSGDSATTNELFAKEEKKIFDIIRGNSNTTADAEKTINAYKNSLQVNVVEKSVTSAHIAKLPHSEILSMINDIADNNNDPTINSDAIRQAGEQKAKELFNIDIKRKQEDREDSLGLYEGVLNRIVTGDLTTMPKLSEIQSLGMDKNHETNAIQVLNGRTVNLTNKVNKANKDTNLLLLDEIANSTPYQKEIATAQLIQRIKEGKVGTAELIAFRKVWQARYSLEETDRIDTNFAPYFAELEITSSYANPPSYFYNNVDKLKKLGVIGVKMPGGTAKPRMTVQQYLNKVNAYARKYNVETENRYKAIEIKDKHTKGGFVGGQDVIKQLELTKSVPKNIRINGIDQPINILSNDKDVANASLVKAVRFTTDYNTLHPSLVDAFSQIGNINDDEMFTKVTMAYSMLSESFRVNGKVDGKLGLVLEASNVNDYAISNSRSFGMDLTNKIAIPNTESKQRIISKFAPNGETEYEVFEKTFKSFTNQDYITDLLLSNTQLGVLFTMGTMDNLTDVIMDDPRMMTMMNDMFWAYASSGEVTPDNKGMNYAMGKVLTKLFSQIGIMESKSENGSTVKRWTFNPPLKQFESTMPTTQTDDGVSEGLPIQLKSEDLYKYIHYSINGQPNMWNRNDGFKEGHEKMDYEIVPNENYGATPSYSIYIKNGYGGKQEVYNNFRFDWATSPQNEAYKNAINTIEDNDFRKWVYGLPGMKAQQVRAIYNRWNSNMSPDSIIMDLQTLYNQAQSILPLDKQTPINLTQYDAAKKNAFLKTLGLDFSLWLEK